MKLYDYKKFDTLWQKKWAEDKLYHTPTTPTDKKVYVLDMFPYPSGEGLHVGHPKGYIATDIYSRFKRMNGYDVLHPMGWDAFGLPAEQFALKNKVHPKVAVEKNVANFKRQLSHLGLDYDWSREINTTDPAFYKWTQWIFTKLYEKGLAYESNEPINWCPSCKTGLANEDVNHDGTCERCDTHVEKKPLRQWVLKITDYADRMLTDLDTLNWPEGVKTAQKNWIGRSEGAEFEFELVDGPEKSVRVFTTRADTLYGATFVAISAELASTWIMHGLIASEEIKNYIATTLEEQKQEKDYTKVPEKTGIFTGIYAINPSTKEKIPVWIANYVLGGVGTGAIMAVPAHDERDFDFARKYGIHIKNVINPVYVRDDIQEGQKVEQKNKIVAIVENQKGEILCVNWGPKLGGKLFLGGTIEKDEKPDVTALRELAEETGYDDAEVIAVSEETFQYTYYAFSKEKYYCASTKFIHIRLRSDRNNGTTLEENEKNKFEILWLSKEKAEKEVLEVLHKRAYDLFIKNMAYTEEGLLYNSGVFDGLRSEEAKIKIIESFAGKKVIKYKIQDWTFARQRYWGEPFPVVRDANGKVYMVDESELPVLLPEVESYEPTGTGESPLAAISDWVNVKGYITDKGTFKQSLDGDIFTRETNTMPQWAGSSWYYLRFIDPHNDKVLIDPSLEKSWQPVDVYVGGDHATRHLIYARFWHKFLYDIGVVTTIEPFSRLEFLGFILAEDGRKMSKRWGNIINPDDVISEYGADTLRVYEMFMAPFEQTAAWSTTSIKGSDKFLDRVYALREKISETSTIISDVHKTIKKVTEDIEKFKFNTAVSSMMILVNNMEEGTFTKEDYSNLLQILAPFAPHLTEQIWNELGNNSSIHTSVWPVYDDSKLIEKDVTISLQINGKLRGTCVVSFDSSDETVIEAVQSIENYKKYVGENTPKKTIVIKNRLVNVVI